MATRARVPPTRADHRAEPAPEGPTLAYQPALDGLRGVAVLAVLLYHGGARWMRGGFLGVDLFFVLSGYLITTLLLTEWGRSGNISLRRFWGRRARRLLPALGLVLVGVALYALFVASASQVSSIRDDALASIGYVANWRFVFSNQSYFAQFAAPSPLRHMWSLAIEEQFYLLWPFILMLLLRRRLKLRVLAQVLGGAAIASAVLMAVLYKPHTDPSRVYYGTDTRAQALLAGATLAVVLFRLGLRNRGKAPASQAPFVRAGLGGMVVLLVMLIAVRDSSGWMYRGGYLVAAAACAAIIAGAVQTRRNVVRMVLSPLPLRSVGKISYGLYLWHWPLYLTITADRTGLDGNALLLVRLAVTGAVATASYFFLEMPIRTGSWPTLPRRALVFVPSLAGVLALVFVLVPVVRHEEKNAVATPTVTTSAVKVPPARLMTMGDSVAGALYFGFDRASHAIGTKVFNRSQPGCLVGPATVTSNLYAPPANFCKAWLDRWPQYVAEVQPDVTVVIFDVFVVQDLESGGKELKFGTKASDKYLLAHLDKDIDVLRSKGGKVVVLTSPYNHRTNQTVDWPEDHLDRTDHWNQLLRKYVKQRKDPGVTLADLNKFVSPDGQYTNTLEGMELRYDGVHFNPEASVRIFQWLLPQLPSGPAPTTTTTVTTTAPD